MSDKAVIDREQLLERIDNDAELLVELTAIYEEDSAATLAEIAAAAAAGDAVRLERSAHSLKGSSFNMSAGRVADIALALEKLGKGGITAGADKFVPQLQTAFAEAVAELKRICEEIS